MDRERIDACIECHRAFEGRLNQEEAKVAWLVSLGRTNVRIGGDLGIGLSRVKWLLVRVFLKTGVEDRHALGEKVQDRVAALQQRDARRKSPLRIVRRRTRPGEADEQRDARSAPDA